MNTSKFRAVRLGLSMREFPNNTLAPVHSFSFRPILFRNSFVRCVAPLYLQSFPKLFSSARTWKRSAKSPINCHHSISSCCMSHFSTRAASDMFPNPISSLHSLNSALTTRLSCAPVFSCKFRVDTEHHVCELQLNWPESRVFTARAHRKKAAQTTASLEALHWLYSKNFITKSSKPVLQDVASSKNNLFLDLTEPSITQIDAVLKVYSEDIVPALRSSCTTAYFQENKVRQEDRIHPTLGRPFLSIEDLDEWSRTLQSCQKFSNSSELLPIDSYKDKILETIRNNRVIVLNGETGCGKTSKVPQFILDQAISEGKGAYCNIAVAQPRRVTTVEIAKFVAKERGEAIGQSVGYSIKMKSILPEVPGGSIVFLTGMKLAQKFIENPSLIGVSHVILDEAHMRDIGTDLLMTLLKRALKVNKDLRVVIMSATANAVLFQSYFNDCGEVPVVNVPGRTFPVKMHFLNGLPNDIVARKSRRNLLDPKIDFELVHRLVLWINETKPPGGILIFVGGWSDMAELQKNLSNEESLLLIPMHSMYRDCSSAFEPTPEGKRKVILATNIAETSITFPDIIYVIDCGIHKKPQRDLLSPGGWSSSRMSTEWISKANVKQRSGRAGRVQPGESFHLFTEQKFRKMSEFEMPNIMLESLEYLVLSVKTINPDVRAVDLMKEFPSPPCEDDIKEAVCTLQAANLLSVEELPTPLATAVMRLSASLPSALALIYSSVYKCFSTTLAVISCEEAQLAFGTVQKNSTAIRALKESYHRSSDHLAKAKALNDSCQPYLFLPSYGYARDLQSFLRNQVISMSDFFSGSNLDDFTSQELVQSVLLSSFGSLIVKSYGKFLKVHLRDKSGINAAVRSRSINCNPRKLKFPFLMYLEGHLSKNALIVDETTVVSPLSILLFLSGDFQTMVHESLTTIKGPWNDNVSILMKNENYLRVQALRKALKDVFDYFVIAEALNQPDDNNFELLCHFRKILLDCIKDSLKLEWDRISENNETSMSDQ